MINEYVLNESELDEELEEGLVGGSGTDDAPDEGSHADGEPLEEDDESEFSEDDEEPESDW